MYSCGFRPEARRQLHKLPKEIGDYRIIFDVREATIVVLRIGHRSEIYR